MAMPQRDETIEEIKRLEPSSPRLRPTLKLRHDKSAGMSAADAANADPDGDGLTTAQEYVAGTDPNDPDSTFTASIEMVDGQPIVTYAPDLLEERQYKKLGKKDIGNPDEAWEEVKDGEEGNYNFFKVMVELP